MPSKIIIPIEHYADLKEKFQKEILDWISFENSVDFFYGIKDLIKMTNNGLIECFVANYNYANSNNTKTTYIDPYCFLQSMNKNEKSVFANKIRDIIREQFLSFWKDYINDLVYYIKTEADDYIIRKAYADFHVKTESLIVQLHKEYNAKIAAEDGAIQRDLHVLQLLEIPEDERVEFVDLVFDAVVERYKKL